MQTTKELIIQESIKLFYENGLNRTSLRQIAKACNIAHPSIFHHFKNKTAIADVMLFRYLHGFVRMTRRYIEENGVDIASSHDGMIFYWTAHYHYIKKDQRYFDFLMEHCTPQRMGDFIMVNYFRQTFKQFIQLNQNGALENQLLYTRIITSTVLIISQSYYENMISFEEAVEEHFHHLYSTYKLDKRACAKDIEKFLINLNRQKYFDLNLRDDVLLSDFGKPYQNIDTENLFI